MATPLRRRCPTRRLATPAVAWFDAHPEAPPTRTRARRCARPSPRSRPRATSRVRDRPASSTAPRRSGTCSSATSASCCWPSRSAGGARHCRSSRRCTGNAGRGRRLPPRALPQAWIERDLARAALLDEMRDHDVLVCPVASPPAFVTANGAGTSTAASVGYLDAMLYTQWFNILGNSGGGGAGRPVRRRACRSACRWWAGPSRSTWCSTWRRHRTRLRRLGRAAAGVTGGIARRAARAGSRAGTWWSTACSSSGRSRRSASTACSTRAPAAPWRSSTSWPPWPWPSRPGPTP